MTDITRSLTFKSKDLGNFVTLVLSFATPNPQLPLVDQLSIAWKMTTLKAIGPASLDVTWSNPYGFCTPQVEEGSRVTAGTHVAVPAGGTTTLRLLPTSHGPPVYVFTDPITEPETTPIQAINGTDYPTEIGVGFITHSGTPSEQFNVMSMLDIKANDTLSCHITPKLSAYLAVHGAEGEKPIKPVWSADLDELKRSTMIFISRNEDGTFIAQQLKGNELELEDKNEIEESARVDDGASQ